MRARLIAAAVAAGCSSPVGHTADPLPASLWLTQVPAPEPRSPPAQVVPPPARAPVPPPPPAPEPPYPPHVRSVELAVQAPVYTRPTVEPDENKRAGVARAGTRMAPVRAAPRGNGCARRWIEVAPRGWVCETVLVPSARPPTESEPPLAFADDDPRPIRALYGSVRKRGRAYRTAEDVQEDRGRDLRGHHAVRAIGVERIDGVRYWRTSGGDLIGADHIYELEPSRWKGVQLDERTPLPIWVSNRIDPFEPVDAYAAPGGAKAGRLRIRERIAIRETSTDGAWIRVAPGLWVGRRDVRIARTAPPPPGLAAGERWFDIDLDEQVLFAYEGERPVYVTLVSTGKPGHATPTGVTRIYAKHVRSSMSSAQIPSETYDVADVPWTMYFDRNYALHTSYWHDLFGNARSHGCVNLAPRDARLLFAWSAPALPPGWTSVYGDADRPGTLVRVRSSRTPEPALRDGAAP
ncbi:MAG: L,D-transpeptidase [Deltaproteobacteria bacterium]|nr:L,D-transpeptidase [Deltaproteobacteria bacterium]